MLGAFLIQRPLPKGQAKLCNATHRQILLSAYWLISDECVAAVSKAPGGLSAD